VENSGSYFLYAYFAAMTKNVGLVAKAKTATNSYLQKNYFKKLVLINLAVVALVSLMKSISVPLTSGT
jgi:hypothetical protein